METHPRDHREPGPGNWIRHLTIALLFSTASPTLNSQPTSQPRTRYLQQLSEANDLQLKGIDISAVVPWLKDQRNAVRFGNHDALGELQDATGIELSRLSRVIPQRALQAALQIHVDQAGPQIPALAANIVIQDPIKDDPRWIRFREEIGLNLVQLKLFLHDLNESHDNYPFLKEPELWRQTVRDIHASGGKVMLHLRNIPSRLSLVPEANVEPTDGKGPLSGPLAETEWSEIVQETIRFFNQDPTTRIDYVQLLGELNIGTNWVDPRDRNNRPANPEAYVGFHQLTAQAIYDVDPNIKVGGPTLWFTTNQELWWDGFLGGLSADGFRLDFATVHIYDVNFGIWDQGVQLTKDKLNQFGFSDTPIFMTEWNTNISTLDLPGSIRRSHIGASHAIVGFQRILDQSIDHTYFFLGPGAVAQELRPGAADSTAHALLLARNERARANLNYNAFRLFTQLHHAKRITAVSNDDRLIAIAARHKNSIEILATYYPPLHRYLDESQPSKLFAYQLPDWSNTITTALHIQSIPFPSYRIERIRIDHEHANLTTQGIRGAELSPETIATHQAGSSQNLELNLPVYGVQLIRIVAETPNTLIDANRNGIPDNWERRFQLPSASNALADLDNDGLSNLREYLLGTNPTDAADALRSRLQISREGVLSISSILAEGDGYENLKRRYTIQKSPNLLDWSDLPNATNLPAQAGTIEAQTSLEDTVQFFRLQVSLEEHEP